MLISPLTNPDQISIGAFLLVSDGKRIFPGTVKLIEREIEGTEVVFNVRCFNLKMFLSGESWAKSVYVVTP